MNDRGMMLREQRLKLGFSLQDIGRAVGIDPYRYMRYENGRMDIMKASYDVACGILLFLHLDLETFYQGQYRANGNISVVDGRISYGGQDGGGLKLYLRSNGYDAEATGIFTLNNHLIVLEGSRISLDSKLGEKGYTIAEELRQKLIADGVVRERLFTRNYDFHSPSEACSVICGRHLSGTIVWVTEDGTKLGRLKGRK